MLKVPRIWEVFEKFKDHCTLCGWRTSKNDDWIKIDDTYHNFIRARNIQPSSFKRIISNRKFVISEAFAYRIAEASYSAFLFSEKPSETLVETLSGNPSFFRRIAIYDLSAFPEQKMCLKLNRTASPVFKKFELFLEKEFKISFDQLPNQPLSPDNCYRAHYVIN